MPIDKKKSNLGQRPSGRPAGRLIRGDLPGPDNETDRLRFRLAVLKMPEKEEMGMYQTLDRLDRGEEGDNALAVKKRLIDTIQEKEKNQLNPVTGQPDPHLQKKETPADPLYQVNKKQAEVLYWMKDFGGEAQVRATVNKATGNKKKMLEGLIEELDQARADEKRLRGKKK